jgi:RNA polymerase sigma factor (sigma-70 family)
MNKNGGCLLFMVFEGPYLSLKQLSEGNSMLSTRMANFIALTSARAPSERQDDKLLVPTGVEFPATAESARVAVVDNHERTRLALVFQVSTAGFEVASYASPEELLASKDVSSFDCIVAEIFLPRMNGLQLQEQLSESHNFASMIFVTERDDLPLVVQAMKAGAIDVLGIPVDDEALLTAIELGVQRSRARATEHAQRLDLEQRFRSLPPRQREVFTLVTAGLLNKQVAAELGISERTVKVHRERLRRKMGADSLAELSRMAGTLQIPARAPFAGRN